jgi:hypothetical protein
MRESATRPEDAPVWKRFFVLAAAICPLFPIGCGGSSPTSPSRVGISELSSAPTRIVADGQSLTLAAFLWRDFMPISPPEGKPLVAVLQIRTDDGSPASVRINADTSWVIHDTEVWSATVEERPRAETTPVYEVVARNGPKWGPDIAVDVVVRLVDSTGRAFLLRAPQQTIRATN